jgi:hypothetical protein
VDKLRSSPDSVDGGGDSPSADDAAPESTGPDADASFCSSVDAAFCADFDEGPVDKGWDALERFAPSTLSLDSTVAKSAPASAVVHVVFPPQRPAVVPVRALGPRLS